MYKPNGTPNPKIYNRYTHREKEIQITLKIIIKREEKARINKITKTTPKQ